MCAGSGTPPNRLQHVIHYLSGVAEDKIRLGGMALANGVLVHGPNAWACAIRTDDGDAEGRLAPQGAACVPTSPTRSCAARRGLRRRCCCLPQVKRALPEAKLPFERPRVVGTMLVSALAANALRRSRLRPLTRELA